MLAPVNAASRPLKEKIIMKIVVIGATGGSGRAAVSWLLKAGHEVTAFARRPEKLDLTGDRLRRVSGDALSLNDVERAVAGQDAVVVTLGITENPVRVRVLGPAGTPVDVRSRGTEQVIAAMRRQGVSRLIVQTTYGVGTTRARLRWMDRMFFALLLAPQIADTERQNALVADSGLSWTLVQPVHLTDAAEHEMPFSSTSGETARMSLSRSSVGRFLAEAATSQDLVGQCVALSGAAQAA
jgi:putative NADH-flavin reductase